MKQLKSKMSKSKKTAEAKQKLIEELQQSLPEWNKQLEKLSENQQKQETKLEQMHESLKHEAAQLHLQLDKKQQELMPWSKKINEKQSMVDLTKSELSLLQQKINAAKNEYEQALQEAEEVKKSLEAKEKLRNEVSGEISAAEKKIAKLESSGKEMEEKEQNLLRAIRKTRVSYEEGKVNLEQIKSQSGVLTGLMRAQKNGILSGVYGRLGDLGTIEDKYDVAISTACPALNSIVVETTKDAQKCVKYLRAKNLGRATFMILEKQQHLLKQLQAPISTPMNVPRLVDLVKPNEESFLPAFYHALRDTLVAKDIDEATKIAYNNKKRWRVVTLQGQVIDVKNFIPLQSEIEFF